MKVYIYSEIHLHMGYDDECNHSAFDTLKKAKKHAEKEATENLERDYDDVKAKFSWVKDAQYNGVCLHTNYTDYEDSVVGIVRELEIQ